MTTCQGAKGTGTLYSYSGLEGLWINAGGPKSYAPLMAAIATAESGGCSTAYNASGATGLWQILGAVDPADQPKLTDPATNAKEALLKFRSQGLNAWVTYTSGAYKQYLNGNVPPDLNVKGTGSGSGAQTTAYNPDDCLLGFGGVPGTSWIQDLTGGGGNIGSTCILPKSSARAMIGGGLMVGGGLILALGVVVLVAYGLKGGGGQKAEQALTVVSERLPATRATRAVAQRSAAHRAPRSAPATSLRAVSATS
jgi:hypothetical protein